VVVLAAKNQLNILSNKNDVNLREIFDKTNREDAAQRLQRFVHWEASFEETFHRRLASSPCPRAST
jgi:hypothetical protein